MHKKLFYRPAEGVAADFIPFEKDGVFYLFYLQDFRDIPGRGEGCPWYLLKTADFVNFEEVGEVIPRGREDEQDLYIFTGSVFQDGENYHIFYTGHNPRKEWLDANGGQPMQAIMHAVSKDLEHWTKVPEDTFVANTELWEPHDFRDPFVFMDPETGKYRMLAVERKKNTGMTSGFTTQFVSDDLKHWEEKEPFFAPELYHTHECPDLFRMGDWWYLIFSEYSDRRKTRYVMAKDIHGPWIMPVNDTFDTTAYYAAKSWERDGERYLFGWLSTRNGNNDQGFWEWGGSLIVHRLTQREDGTLACELPESIDQAFQLVSESKETKVIENKYGRADALLYKELGNCYRVDVKLRFEEGTRQFGIGFAQDYQEQKGYKFEWSPMECQIMFNGITDSINTKGMTRLYQSKDTIVNATVIVEDEIAVLYTDDGIALSARFMNGAGSDVSVFAIGGKAEVLETKVYQMKD